MSLNLLSLDYYKFSININNEWIYYWHQIIQILGCGWWAQANFVWKYKWKWWVWHRVWETWWLWCSLMEGSPERIKGKEWIKPQEFQVMRNICQDVVEIMKHGYKYRETWKWLRFGPLGQRSCLWSKSRLWQLLPGITALSSPGLSAGHQPGGSHSSISVPWRRTKQFLQKDE